MKFGQSFTYEDGLSVTISAPVAFKRGEYAAGAEKAKYFRSFTVTLVNKTGKPFDAALFSVTMQSTNEEMEEVFDSAAGLEGSPSTKILNGRESKFKVGFGVANPKDMVLQVAPDFDHEDVVFTS